MEHTSTVAEKALIVFPFWAGDKAQVVRLSKLLTDLTPSHTPAADMLFVSRFDTTQPEAAIRYAARRFNVYRHRSKRREVGWPSGCNGTFIGTIDWLYTHVLRGAHPRYKFIFIAEGDSAPLSRDWLTILCAEWERVNAQRPVVIAGPVVPAGGIDHINGGGCLISARKKDVEWMRDLLARKLMAGWDWVLASEFRERGWANIPGMRSHWNSPPFTESRWIAERDSGTWWIHGAKDDSLTDLARRLL